MVLSKTSKMTCCVNLQAAHALTSVRDSLQLIISRGIFYHSQLYILLWNEFTACGATVRCNYIARAMGDEQLVVIGYECKVFDDAEKALWIDSKSHLVPWNGEKSLMIDRYLARFLKR